MFWKEDEEYNLDISRIVIGGESAGAYFSSYIAAMTKDKSLYLQNNIDFRQDKLKKIELKKLSILFFHLKIF